MNNYKMNYAKKFHYILKYFILALPLIILVIAFFYPFILKNANLPVNNGIPTLSFELFNSYLGSESVYLTDFIYDFIYFFRTGIFSWFERFLASIGFSFTSITEYFFQQFMFSYLLYVLCVYMFDIVLDFLLLLPKLAHRLMNKLGGERYD